MLTFLKTTGSRLIIGLAGLAVLAVLGVTNVISGTEVYGAVTGLLGLLLGGEIAIGSASSTTPTTTTTAAKPTQSSGVTVLPSQQHQG